MAGEIYSYCIETSEGVLPANPELLLFPSKPFDYETNNNTIKSDIVVAGRFDSPSRPDAPNYMLSVSTEFGYSLAQDFLEAFFKNSWTNNELVPARQDKTLFFQMEQPYIKSGDTFTYFRGSNLNTLEISMALKQISSVKLDFMCKLIETALVKYPDSTDKGVDHTTSYASLDAYFLVDGEAYPCELTKVDLSITNNLKSDGALGECPPDLNVGRFTVSGSITGMIKSDFFRKKHKNMQQFPFVIASLDVEGNALEFIMPKCVLEKFKENMSLDDTSEFTADFSAAYDKTIGSSLKVKRIPATI